MTSNSLHILGAFVAFEQNSQDFQENSGNVSICAEIMLTPPTTGLEDDLYISINFTDTSATGYYFSHFEMFTFVLPCSN